MFVFFSVILIIDHVNRSRSSIDGWDYADGEEAASEWTLGESIMRALSKRDLLVIDIDNPQTKR